MSKLFYFNILFLFSASFCSWVHAEEAAAPSTTEYGEIYMLEQRDRVVHPWRVAFNYSYEFGNPYYDIHGLNLTFEHSIGRFVHVGVQGSYLISSKTNLLNTLERELKASDLGAELHIPKYSVYGIGTFIPLSGHFNFFGNYPIEAELAVRLGAGMIAYQDANRFGMIWSLRPTFHLTPQWSIQTGFGQEFEAPFTDDHLVHFKGDVGVALSF